MSAMPAAAESTTLVQVLDQVVARAEALAQDIERKATRLEQVLRPRSEHGEADVDSDRGA